ncbi:phage portal protein [Acetivibrio thermocellus]|uniref:phage portal protein n=1 Tax=Acetivibrio thermocellus TaxID=1515 RepID=UPI0010A6888D|nr:phage portal protein [Acetivibrio thermocellus]THJ78600.1 phage portal protein [Acetivibrio thermocellus]
MTLGEYIKKYYDDSNTWFQDEVTKQWHFERIQNILDLKEYLSGKHAILNRPNEQYNGKPYRTRKIVLQLAKTLLNFETSFLLKNPVTLISEDKNTLEVFKEVYSKARYNSIDFKILDKLVKYGETYEYVYIDENGNITSRIIPAEDSYPVFDETGNMIAFIEFYIVDGISYYIVYTDNEVIKYTDDTGELHITGRFKNISGLPIQYKTINELDSCKGRSSLEDYISIIDSLEDLISKYHDGLYKFISGVPVLRGTSLITKDGKGTIDPSVTGFLLQIDDSADFQIVQNKMDSASFKALYDILMAQLLNISQTPAITMNSVEISNLSETSIRMMYSLASVKARLNEDALVDGFIQRWDKIRKLLALQGIQITGDISCTFEYDIPLNAAETISNITTLKQNGLISLETALSRTPYIYDVATEMQKIKSDTMGSSVASE